MAYSNSPLVSYIKLSPNHGGLRTHKIDTISIHCMAGNGAIETLGTLFSQPSRKASSNYGIGSDGRIGMYVEEKNRSWCTSSAANDDRAITIEVANIESQEPFRISAAANDALIKLLVDICKRNGIERLLWQADPSLIGQVDKQNMTVHRWFANKSCPGKWLYNHHGQIAADVNKILESEEDEEMTQEKFNEMIEEYRKSLQNNEAGSWSREARDWATSIGLIKGGDPLPNGQPNYMWRDFLTREQMATLLYRFKDM